MANFLILSANIMLIKTYPNVSTSCRSPLQGSTKIRTLHGDIINTMETTRLLEGMLTVHYNKQYAYPPVILLFICYLHFVYYNITTEARPQLTPE